MQFEKQFSTVVVAYCHDAYRKFHVYAGFTLAKTVHELFLNKTYAGCREEAL